MIKNKNIFGYILAILAATGFGIQPLFSMLAYEEGVTPNMLSLLEMLIMILFSLVLCLIKKSSLKTNWKVLLEIAFLALFGATLTTILLYQSYQFIDTSIATTLNFTYPVFVIILGAVFYKDKFHKTTLIALGLCIIGVCLFVNLNGTFTFKGFILALFSGLVYAIYILIADKKEITKKTPFPTFMLYYFLFAAFFSLIANLILDHKINLDIKPLGYLYVFLVTIAGGVFAFICLQKAIPIIGGAKVSILGSLEPLTSVICGMIFLNEQPSILNIIGILLILSSTILLVITNNKSGEK